MPSNIDFNVSVDTIFSIYHRITPVGMPVIEKNFLHPGNKQVAASYMVYGSSIILVYTKGYSMHTFTYDPSLRLFCLSHESMHFSTIGEMYSTNENNYTKFPNAVKKYIKYCQEDAFSL